MNEEAPENLVSLFNQGNNRAFASIHTLYFPSIFYFARQFISGRHEAEDIASEAFLKLWQLRGNFENLEKIRSFLYIAAKNDCLDYLRHEKVKSAREEEIISLLSGDGDSFLDKEKITAELSNRINAEIERLPWKCRAIVKMLYIEGLRNEEIAQRLGISGKTVSNQRVLALARLRMALLK